MNKVLKSALGVVAAATIVGVTIAQTGIVSAWGDASKGRRTYTIKQINDGELKGKIVFNSIKDDESALTPEQIQNGDIIPRKDERNFVSGRVYEGAGQGQNNQWTDEIKVEEGKEYILRLYVHNNSDKGLEAVATNVNTYFLLPNVVGKKVEINGFINATGDTINRYWDNVIFSSDQNFYLEYIPGSAKIESNGAVNGSALNDNQIVTYNKNQKTGALVGYDNLDGRVPGCYQYASYVTIRVRPVFESSSIQKKVRLNGDKEWKKSVDAKVGDKVDFMIKFINKNSVQVKDVMILDYLPDNLKYVKGTTHLFNETNPAPAGIQRDDTIATTAVNIGGYAPNGEGIVRFTAEVVDTNLACGTNRLVNIGKAGIRGLAAGGEFAVMDQADVYVEKACKDQPVKTTEHTPGQLPSTGPVAGVLGAGSVITAAGYYVASRKQLRK